MGGRKLNDVQLNNLNRIKDFFYNEIPVKLVAKDWAIINKLAEISNYNANLVISAWEYMKSSKFYHDRMCLEMLLKNFQAIVFELKRQGKIKPVTIKKEAKQYSDLFYLFKNTIPREKWNMYVELWNKLSDKEKQILEDKNETI